MKARGRAYSPIKICTGTLVALGLVIRNLQAVWASAVMTALKKRGFRLESDNHAVNKQIEKVPGVSCRTKRRKWSTCGGRHVLGSLSCCKDIGRCRLRPNPRKCSPSLPPKVSLPPHVCPNDVLNATAYFQGVMTEVVGRLEL